MAFPIVPLDEIAIVEPEFIEGFKLQIRKSLDEMLELLDNPDLAEVRMIPVEAPYSVLYRAQGYVKGITTDLYVFGKLVKGIKEDIGTPAFEAVVLRSIGVDIPGLSIYSSGPQTVVYTRRGFYITEDTRDILVKPVVKLAHLRSCIKK